MKGILRSKSMFVLAGLLMVAALLIPFAVNSTSASRAQAAAALYNFAPTGGLDCNGYSKIQKPIKTYQACADPKGYDGGRFYDNGHYIGHDEPSAQFYSNSPGSGNNVEWTFTLPKEHALPATQTFENTPTFWFSMAQHCRPTSASQWRPVTLKLGPMAIATRMTRRASLVQRLPAASAPMLISMERPI